jgi:hypothetical protein
VNDQCARTGKRYVFSSDEALEVAAIALEHDVADEAGRLRPVTR